MKTYSLAPTRHLTLFYEKKYVQNEYSPHLAYIHIYVYMKGEKKRERDGGELLKMKNSTNAQTRKVITYSVSEFFQHLVVSLSHNQQKNNNKQYQ